jgi:thymidylate kinase
MGHIKCLDTLHHVYSSFPHKQGIHVYLDVPVDTCVERCSHRGTPIDASFMTKLREEHETYFRGSANCIKIVLDGSESPEHVADLILRTVSNEVV